MADQADSDARVEQPTFLPDLSLTQQPALQLVYDTAPIGLAFLSPDCRYLQINQRLTEICGISVEDHLGRTVRECVPALAEFGRSASSASIMTNREPVTGIEVAGQRADQNESSDPGSPTGIRVHGPDGEIVGVNVAAEEITERKRAEAALQASEQQFQTLADSMPQLVWMAEPDGRIFWFNSHWYDYTGVPAEAIAGMDWLTALAPSIVAGSTPVGAMPGGRSGASRWSCRCSARTNDSARS